ncbi:putative pleiotropic drug resistance protein 3 [Coccomyxa subellipsoidea C-169]|uniref:Pleiotropic drug resistance protein 3 n=1 Tax=Coccomyxa subellipsoidea (strain C-169) TaxID=574566 RepID=I0YIH5_COCSC|nr:putative pleiotropic drug resistance protein 3 [Coccomyxa subellipsoidea C-169]EIE18194.1 putative pleiotropic drug resistance protein 3 [Coccomyxa subellipsoidea C-169]|eukprot:XP_005642738.1 putative pleiotropic drug resistance protein 3 [Coccomyxa subellipsoidea C-169]
MAANHWNPGLHKDVSYHPKDLLRGVTSRRRASLGSDAALDADADRDPEMPVDDYEELYRVALERASTMDRPGADGGEGSGFTKLDLKRLRRTHRQLIVDRALQTSDQDNEAFLRKFQDRIKRAGVDVPTVEVRADGLSVDSSVYVGGRAAPTLINAYRNFIEDVLIRLRVKKTDKRPFNILNNVNAVLKPGRLTMLLGPPGAGKTTLLKTLAGKLQKEPSLKVTGQVTYNGETFDKFFPERTAAYVDQVDLHVPELTVRETFDFAARVQGTGLKADFLRQLAEAERAGSIEPDADIDAYLQASAVTGARHNPVTHYMMRVLGLEVCQDTVVGNNMIRGISGGQKKRVTSGEMIVGPKSTMFMDEISTGLDSSTTYLIVKCARNFVHMCQGTMLMALLQPAPEVYELFDDVMLLSEGHVLFHGPIGEVLPFFEGLGFRLPERKGIADFLQEVTSPKDQEQYWADPSRPWSFVPVATIAEAYESSPRGRENAAELARSRPPTADSNFSFARMYALSPVGVFATLFLREVTLMKRHKFVYIFRTAITVVMGFIASTLFIRPTMHRNNVGDASLYAAVMFYSLVHMLFDGLTEMSITIEMLPVFYKQRANLFYPAWAFGMPITILRLPYSLVESFIWSTMLYWIIGFAPDAGRYFTFWLLNFLCHQMAIGLFRLMGAIGRSLVVAYTIAWLIFLLLILLSGFVLSKNRIPDWYIGGYWALPLQWLVSAAQANEFSDSRWAVPYQFNPSITIGQAVAQSLDFRIKRVWVWAGIAVVSAWIVGLNLLTILALKLFPRKGMVLPFQPLNMAFHHVNYSVDLPPGSSATGDTVEGASKPQLTLLTDISGAFRPGVLTCLMGVSGAGKTTLMDVLASRKTGGLVRGDITVDGHPKDAATFARVSGYVEQFDIHSPATTVREALMYSAQLRLVLELMELTPLRGAIVGVPGVSGLSVEQRKRLTIGVELVANPSIVFMDEPTSGLDARAAAIVMRTVRNTVNTGRTVVCTIHQPSIDIFESFDELLLLKRGGRTIYFGPTGDRSAELVNYFEGIRGVPRIEDGINPATWMLEVTAMASEDKLGVDFADLYANSGVARSNDELVTQLQVPAPDSQPLRFDKRYPRSFLEQFLIIIRKNFTLYWRLPDYNAVRLFFTCIFSLLIGSIYWRKGNKTDNAGNMQNVLGALLTAAIFLGTSNASTVQPVVDTERSVFYRERAAGYYSELPFALAQTLVEVPYLLVQTVLYSCITYFMIYFEINAAKFFWYLFFTFLTLSFFTYYGMMAVSISPNVQVAAIISSTFYSAWFLLAGFIIPRPRIPGWWIWFHYLDPLTYTVEGLIASQLGDIHDQLIAFEDGSTASVARYVEVQYGYKHNFIGYAVLVLIGFILLFQAINAFALKNFNFQTR